MGTNHFTSISFHSISLHSTACKLEFAFEFVDNRSRLLGHHLDSALARVGGLTNLGKWLEGAGVRSCPTRATPVALEGDEPGPLAVRAGPDSARCPAPGIAALPPLALGVWVVMPLVS